MRLGRRWAAALLLLAIPVAPVGLGRSQPGPTRAEALAALAQGTVEARREAAARLGEIGSMDDVPALVRALRDDDAGVRSLADAGLWRVWSRSGDAEVDALFAVGLEQMNRTELREAIASFTRVIERKPDFAEGWNKRATLYYLLGEYERSLRDCDEVMKRNPWHYGALAGYGQIHLRLGHAEQALRYFERALTVNPNLEQVELAVEQLRALLRERRKDTI